MVSIEYKREQGRLRRQRFTSSLTLEQKKELYAKNSARRTAKRAAKALAAGKVPGAKGKWKLSPEVLKANVLENRKRFRENNLKERREYEAGWQRKKRAAKATAAGRTPGRIGREAVLTAEQRLENARKNSRSYRIKYPDKAKKISDEYYHSNKEEALARSRNRRAKIKGNGGKHTAADIRALFFEQKDICAWCDTAMDANDFHVDHWKPISKGGLNDKSNLKLLHPKCNLSKGAKLPEQFKIA